MTPPDPFNPESRSKKQGSRFDLEGYLKDRRHRIDQALRAYLHAGRDDRAELLCAMAYSVEAGGKRLRPVLCLAAAHAVGGREDDALPAACALEMIHTYSLIHDDLPAMDNDDLRRGKPTCHKAYTEATAILAGDALLTRAFEILAEHGLGREPREQGRWLRIAAMIARAAGCRGMVEGQMQDIAAEGRRIGRQELEQLHRLKTGALITASILAGAIVGQADEASLLRLERYGDSIGLAFQVVDDILNEEGDPLMMGKAVGTDQLRRKNTYPSLLGLDAAKTKAADLVNGALRSLDMFDNNSDPLRAIARYVIERRR